MRTISRVVDGSINTVAKLLVDAGAVAAAYHDENVRGVAATRVHCAVPHRSIAHMLGR